MKAIIILFLFIPTICFCQKNDRLKRFDFGLFIGFNHSYPILKESDMFFIEGEYKVKVGGNFGLDLYFKPSNKWHTGLESGWNLYNVKYDNLSLTQENGPNDYKIVTRSEGQLNLNMYNLEFLLKNKLGLNKRNSTFLNVGMGRGFVYQEKFNYDAIFYSEIYIDGSLHIRSELPLDSDLKFPKNYSIISISLEIKRLFKTKINIESGFRKQFVDKERNSLITLMSSYLRFSHPIH